MSGSPGLSGSARPVTAAQKSAEGIVAGSPAKARTTDRVSRTATLMRTRRQNIQLELALEPVAKGEARSPDTQGTEARTTHAEPERPETPSNRRVRTRTHGGVGGEEAARLPPIPIFATALRVTAPLGCGSRRLVWPKGSLSARPHGPTPPFSLINSHPFGSARSSPGREAAKRTIDGEDRSGIMHGEATARRRGAAGANGRRAGHSSRGGGAAGASAGGAALDGGLPAPFLLLAA